MMNTLGGQCIPNGPSREAIIGEKLNRIACEIDHMENHMNELVGRISPVLMPDSPQCGDGSAKQGMDMMPPLAETLLGFYNRLYRLNALVSNTINRVEL